MVFVLFLIQGPWKLFYFIKVSSKWILSVIRYKRHWLSSWQSSCSLISPTCKVDGALWHCLLPWEALLVLNSMLLMTSAEPGFISQGRLVVCKNTPTFQAALGQDFSFSELWVSQARDLSSWGHNPLSSQSLYLHMKAFLGKMPAALRFAVWLQHFMSGQGHRQHELSAGDFVFCFYWVFHLGRRSSWLIFRHVCREFCLTRNGFPGLHCVSLINKTDTET